ncbi:PKD domain-containing protein [Pedobacter sp. BS3]|uniref:DUF7849 domain-containing protein n=1 Tax=Pedobacter sp. BS3 TaxID=2567937 RepID=UPI0011EC3D9E|nr:PKD domain-containing protein [Pedobacter sp. BS3]TZF81530.1 PKD domain-containing protein [Pedobacter sp. BS3]
MEMKRLYLTLTICLIGLCAGAQTPATDTVPAVIHPLVTGNQVRFSSALRDLRPVAGAPAPFYSYFWEFGDGQFSFEKEPLHTYPDTGKYNVRLYATNNYDDGKPPPSRPQRILITSRTTAIAAVNAPAFFKSGGSLEMKTNRMPRPGEEMILLIGYRNKPEWGALEMKGKVALWYNEKEFKQNNFVLQDVRAYHGEKRSASPLNMQLAYVDVPGKTVEDWKQKGAAAKAEEQKKASGSSAKEKHEAYRANVVWDFNGLKSGEERYLFVSLKTTPEMVQDTNAVVTLSGMFVPDDPILKPETFDLQLQIVASHDPNKMMLKNRRMNYRFTGKKRELKYKVRFQNTGEGPAKRVAIGVKMPGVVDVSSLKIGDMQPRCLPCDSAYAGQSCIDTLRFKDSVQFVFKNIYLPGVKQKGVNDVDSTKGYIEYSVRFTKKPKKLPFASQAAIVFDKNEPIYTNRSRGVFKPGLSPGIIAVYGTRPGHASKQLTGNNNFSFGLSISPYAPYRKYLQAEIYVSRYDESETLVSHTGEGYIVYNGRDYKIDHTDEYLRSKVVTIDIVPVQLRYNLNRWVGVGAGTLVNANLSTTKQTTKNIYVANAQGTTEMFQEKSAVDKSSFNTWKVALFGDVQAGLVRTGPTLGMRYLYYPGKEGQRLYFYLSWKI